MFANQKRCNYMIVHSNNPMWLFANNVQWTMNNYNQLTIVISMVVNNSIGITNALATITSFILRKENHSLSMSFLPSNIFKKKIFFLKMLLWKRRMQFWQQPSKIFRLNPKKNSKNFKKKCSKCSSGHVETLSVKKLYLP